MGDQIELTTSQTHQDLYYKISSNIFFVDIRAPGNACIGLLSNINTTPEVLIFLGVNNLSASGAQAESRIVNKGSACATIVSTPNILSEDEYRRFWITCSKNVTSIGRAGESNPIMDRCNNYHQDICFITYISANFSNSVHWKFEVPPPYLEKKIFHNISGGKLQWVDAGTQLPDGALIGGYEKEILYIIRALHNGSLTPGKFVPSQGVGYIPWGGGSHQKNSFEVLCGYDCTWISTSGNKVPVNAVEVGYNVEPQERLYLGRAFYKSHLIPGKVLPSYNTCFIPYRDGEVPCTKYEVLVAPCTKIRSVNKVYRKTLSIHGVGNWDVHSDVEDSLEEQESDDDSLNSNNAIAF